MEKRSATDKIAANFVLRFRPSRPTRNFPYRHVGFSLITQYKTVFLKSEEMDLVDTSSATMPCFYSSFTNV